VGGPWAEGEGWSEGGGGEKLYRTMDLFKVTFENN